MAHGAARYRKYYGGRLDMPGARMTKAGKLLKMQLDANAGKRMTEVDRPHKMQLGVNARRQQLRRRY